MVDLITMDYITISSISLRIPQGLLQKKCPRVTQMVVNVSVSTTSHKYHLIKCSRHGRKIFPAAAL